MRSLAGIAALIGLLALPASAQTADAFPQRGITIIVPYTPGTGGDLLARMLGPRLAERWKVPVVTENRPGASGNIGAELVAKAAPDGYTLLSTATSFGTNPPLQSKLPFDPIKSFAPVTLLATSDMGLYGSPASGFATLAEFLDAARRQPGKLNYASPGNGTPQHLAMELFRLETGIDIVHVPYKGSSGALGDLVAGHVHAMMIATQTATSFVQTGKLRMLASMSARRQASAPDVPTMNELGYPRLEIVTWYGIFAPAGTPAPVIAKLNNELNALVGLPEVREQLARLWMTPAGGSPERFGMLVAAELSRWSRVVTQARIHAD